MPARFSFFSSIFKGQQSACQDHDNADHMYSRAAANRWWRGMEDVVAVAKIAVTAGEITCLHFKHSLISTMGGVTNFRENVAKNFLEASFPILYYLCFLLISYAVIYSREIKASMPDGRTASNFDLPFLTVLHGRMTCTVIALKI